MNEQLETIICGGTAGLVSRFFIAPLDVLKIRLQLASNTSFKKIVQEEGIRGLWKGNASAELLYVTYSATQFLAYTELKHLNPFVAGASAGAIATTVTYPFDLFRTRFAARKARGGLYRAFTTLIKDEGFRGMYRGLGASIVQIVPYMGLLFGTYEPIKQHTNSAIAGAAAGALSKTGVFPLDVIRKRMQVQGPTLDQYVPKISQYDSALHCVRQIWLKEGIVGFYRGLTISLIKSAPSSA
jgi:solute carrier family 25 (mitochondrial thiamine pyrophosphate transporter), member 19